MSTKQLTRNTRPQRKRASTREHLSRRRRLRRKPGIYHAAKTVVYCTVNTENAAEVGESNPSQRSPKPNVSQSPVTPPKSPAKAPSLRVDIHHTTATRTKDFAATIPVGYESENDRTGKKSMKRFDEKQKCEGTEYVCEASWLQPVFTKMGWTFSDPFMGYGGVGFNAGLRGRSVCRIRGRVDDVEVVF
jgi:hypothetical protein